jgi:hypothetical protein
MDITPNPGPGAAPQQPAPPRPPQAAEPTAPRDVAEISSHQRVVIPAENPPQWNAIQNSHQSRYIIGGTIAGAMAGTYVSLTMLTAYPPVAIGVLVGSGVAGAVMGWLASKK